MEGGAANPALSVSAVDAASQYLLSKTVDHPAIVVPVQTDTLTPGIAGTALVQ